MSLRSSRTIRTCTQATREREIAHGGGTSAARVVAKVPAPTGGWGIPIECDIRKCRLLHLELCTNRIRTAIGPYAVPPSSGIIPRRPLSWLSEWDRTILPWSARPDLDGLQQAPATSQRGTRACASFSGAFSKGVQGAGGPCDGSARGPRGFGIPSSDPIIDVRVIIDTRCPLLGRMMAIYRL